MSYRNNDLQVHRLTINGHLYQTPCHPHDTLLEVIRYNLDLIGTKQGCDKGDCGACTVLVDGLPTLSCLSLAHNFSEQESIVTVEGLSSDEILLEAFVKSGALQCGFCQPGMILSAKALLEKNQSPSLSQIKHALSGNLCRCTGYTKIYLAVLCASLVITKQAASMDDALVIMRDKKTHLGEAC